MTRQSYRTWLIALALLGVVVDQASKYLVFSWLYKSQTYFDPATQQGNYTIIPDAFRLYVQYTHDPAEGPLRRWSSDQMPHVNHGALFGLGNDRKISANYFFAFVSVVAGFAIVGWSFRRNTTGDRLLCVALGLILGGTLGNLYDRIVFDGVRDFLYWSRWFDWPVFNIADCCLVVGAFLLLAQAFLTHPAPAEAPVLEGPSVSAAPQAVPVN